MESIARSKKNELMLGIPLFTIAVSLYSVYCLLIKIALYKYSIGVAELMYMISCWAAPSFFLIAKL